MVVKEEKGSIRNTVVKEEKGSIQNMMVIQQIVSNF